ncbi:MAG: NfeD family protein [Oscillospiraceae bacterium]|jgi:membrane protein implicated in regulation of membrane protease activity
MSPIIIWLAVLVIFVIIEAATYALTSIWFAAGALAALIAAALKAPLWLQVLIFLAVTAVSLAATRPLARRLMAQGKKHFNADSVLGETGIVTETIDNLAGSGAVRIQGKLWTARSLEGEVIPEGERVRIERIEGVKLIVCPAQEAAIK